MTKKDFELIASAIKDYINYSYDVEDTDNFIVHDYAERIAYKMADALESKNPRFDKNKFLQACGVEWQYCCHDYNYRNGGKCSNCGK